MIRLNYFDTPHTENYFTEIVGPIIQMQIETMMIEKQQTKQNHNNNIEN